MSINCRKADDGTPIMQVTGRLDFNRRDEFIGILETFLGEVATPEVHVDCARLDYVDSSGLGLLLVLRDRVQRLGSKVALIGCSESVREVLETVQFGRLFRMT